jgi:hypothetical protein
MTLNSLTQLAEEVLGKAAQNPTASKVLQSAMQLKERVDDLTRRVRGLEAMERRIEQLEKRLAKLESSHRSSPGRKKRAAKTGGKKATAKD